MSLLEDLVDLLRCVLEYFGVPAEMLVPGWESDFCGQYRSIVRMIGTNLPLRPYPRVHFQIPLQALKTHGHIDVSVDTPAIPSLADVLWLAEDEGDSCAKFRSAVPLRQSRWPQGFENPGVKPERPAGSRALAPNTQPAALQKISALEAELLKLRAQIAMIVAAPSADSSIPPSVPSTPCSTPLPAAILTSTPVSAPPPPPPPPPPLPPALPNLAQNSVTDIIKQRQTARKNGDETPQQQSASTFPSMMDVLKDMNQVKLRTVERSPGGTPVRKRRSKGTACASDPASLIAEALKRKFAHKQRDNSFDKENRSAELSPFSSPDTPKVLPRRGQHRVHLSLQ